MKLIAIGAIAILGSILLVVFLWPTETAHESETEYESRRAERTEVSDTEKAPLISVYDGIRVSTDSTVLDISNRALTGSLKAEIRLLTRLKTLDISNNEFTGLPAEVGQLTQLRELNLSNNPLTGLPHELGNLQNLEILNVSGTNYSETDLDIIRERLPSTVTIRTQAPPLATSTEVFQIQGRLPD